MCNQKIHLGMRFITCLNLLVGVWAYMHVIKCFSWKGQGNVHVHGQLKYFPILYYFLERDTVVTLLYLRENIQHLGAAAGYEPSEIRGPGKFQSDIFLGLGFFEVLRQGYTFQGCLYLLGGTCYFLASKL